MLETLLSSDALLPVVVTLVTLAVTKGVGLLKKAVLKTETKVDDALVEAVIAKLKDL